MSGAAGTSTSSRPTNGKNKASNRSRKSKAGATSGVLRKTNDQFCLGRISFKQNWDCDESNSTETHQAWEPSSHRLIEGSFADIQAHTKKSKDVTIDEEQNIIIPRSYVKCGHKKHDVKSFQLDEKLKIIKISWSPTPRDEVEKSVEPVSHRVLRSAMPPDTPTRCQFLDQPNPYGPFIWNPKPAESPREDFNIPTGSQYLDPPNPHGRYLYWLQPARPTRDELAERVQQLEKHGDEKNNTIRTMEKEMKQLKRENTGI